MGITVGIDIGGSTTKIVGVKDNEIITPFMVRASDPIASLYGGFGKFISENSLDLSDIKRVAVTGVGAASVNRDIYGIPTVRVKEFHANGLGGLELSGLTDAVIVSMGTGTAFVRAKKDGEFQHIGGTGIGGGTIIGLSNLLLNIRNIEVLIEMAATGNLGTVDLTVGDITRGAIESLPPNTTASNFGKLSDIANKSDIALAIFNLVFQTIGVMAVFASKSIGTSEAVLIGNLSTIPYCQEVFAGLEALHGFRFVIPKYSEHGTAVGAALAIDRGTPVA